VFGVEALDARDASVLEEGLVALGGQGDADAEVVVGDGDVVVGTFYRDQGGGVDVAVGCDGGDGEEEGVLGREGVVDEAVGFGGEDVG
jgi:hypothetical protein